MNIVALTWSNDPVFQVYSSELVRTSKDEDSVWQFSPIGSAIDVRSWTIEFNLAASENANVRLTITNENIAKTIGGLIEFTLPYVIIVPLRNREYYYELLRTDAGSRKLLRFGRWRAR